MLLNEGDRGLRLLQRPRSDEDSPHPISVGAGEDCRNVGAMLGSTTATVHPAVHVIQKVGADVSEVKGREVVGRWGKRDIGGRLRETACSGVAGVRRTRG